jgi:hypothetical protein
VGRGVEIIKPDEHWRALAEVAGGVQYALDKLDSDVQIFFNTHRAQLALPDDAIIFNAEQVPVYGDTLQQERWKQYLERMKRHVVWDYSAVNAARLRLLGVERVVHCRIGWWPGLVSVPQSSQQDIDVLFVGSMNARRATLIYDLGKRVKVKTLFGTYGWQRDQWMARSKVVLCAHFYEHPIHEIFRTSHAVANGKCVVSEDGGCDPELEAFAKDATTCVPYSGIVDACESLVLSSEERRESIGQRGRQIFEGIDQIAEVRAALERT